MSSQSILLRRRQQLAQAQVQVQAQARLRPLCQLSKTQDGLSLQVFWHKALVKTLMQWKSGVFVES